MKPRALVFDLFGDYIRYRGGWVRLLDLTRLLEVFSVNPGTTRVVMSRLRKEGWFDTRPGSDGREAVVGLNERSWRTLDEGRERILTRNTLPWSGTWHLALYVVSESERAVREDLRKSLLWHGYGSLAPSTWISPNDRSTRILEDFQDRPGVQLDLFEARSQGIAFDRDIASRCWDFDKLNQDYGDFISKYRGQLPRLKSGLLNPEEALVARTQIILEYRRFPFNDPDLPSELLPKRWRGLEAFELFIAIRATLKDSAEECVDKIMTSGHPDN